MLEFFYKPCWLKFQHFLQCLEIIKYNINFLIIAETLCSLKVPHLKVTVLYHAAWVTVIAVRFHMSLPLWGICAEYAHSNTLVGHAVLECILRISLKALATLPRVYHSTLRVTIVTLVDCAACMLRCISRYVWVPSFDRVLDILLSYYVVVFSVQLVPCSSISAP